MGLVELLAGIIAALLAAIGVSRWQLRRERDSSALETLDREHYGWAELERVRRIAAEARATADREENKPIDEQGRTDFEGKP